MTHLRIEQNESAVEYVSSAVIEKLYDLATSGDLDNTSNLQGTLHAPITYLEYEQAIETAFPNLHISADNYYIWFQDSEILKGLLAKGIGDGIGIKASDAASVTSNNEYNFGFAGNTQITSFNELQYFTNINGVVGFNGCTNLSSVTLPTSKLLYLGRDAFRDTSISTINTEKVKFFGNNCFWGTNISYLDMSSAINVNSNIVRNVSNNIDIKLPETPWTGGLHSFGRYSAHLGQFTNIDAFESWTRTSKALPSLDGNSICDIINFKNCTTLYVESDCAGLCQNCTTYPNPILKAIYMPKVQQLNVTYIWDNRVNPFFGAEPQTIIDNNYKMNVGLIYFKDVASIQWGVFLGLICNALVINNTTPPTIVKRTGDINEYQAKAINVIADCWGNIENATDSTQDVQYWSSRQECTAAYQQKKLYTSPIISNIYVPDSAVNTYKAATGWIPVASLIKPISELNSGIIYSNKTDWQAAGKPMALIADHLDLSSADLSSFVSANNLSYYST